MIRNKYPAKKGPEDQEIDQKPIIKTKSCGLKEGQDPHDLWKSHRWQGDDEQAFYNWLDDIKPRVKQGNKYEVWDPTEEQKRLITAIFERDGDQRKHKICLAVQPRRHGKSSVHLIVALFYFTTRKNITIGLLGNSDDHTHRTMFKRIEGIVRNTPELRRRIDPDKNFLNDYARLQDSKQILTWQNLIIKCANSMQGAFGETLDILIASDLHATMDMEPFEAWRSALLDAKEGITLIDCQVDHVGGPIDALEKLAEEDPAVFCSHIEYADLEDYCLRAPAWISRAEARIASKRDLETAFNRDILGKRSAQANSLFPEILIRACIDSFKQPVLDIKSLAHGRPYKIGGGLDRAKLLSPLMGGDRSILTFVAKIAQVSGEPEYFVLEATNFLMNTSANIKSKIIEADKRWSLTNIVLENYEVMDILPYLASMNIPNECIHPTENAQSALFPELHRILKDGRLHLPKNCPELADEMRAFCYNQKRAGIYSFGASKGWHDDFVYSLGWAIWSLRNEILSMYQLDHLNCTNQSSLKRSLCFLFGGSKVLQCSQTCQACKAVQEMFLDFKAFQALDSEINVIQFYKAYVKTQDAVIQYQAV